MIRGKFMIINAKKNLMLLFAHYQTSYLFYPKSTFIVHTSGLSPFILRRFSVDSPSFVRRLSVHSPSILRPQTENDRRDKEESTTNSLTIMRNQREKCQIASSVEFYHLQIFNLCAINNETYKRANLMKARHPSCTRIDMKATERLVIHNLEQM